MNCPPLQDPWRSLDPTLGTTVLNGLSNYCVSESHMATRITESTCSEALARDTFEFLWGLAINTITAIGLRVSLYARPLSGFCARSGSKRTSGDDKFRQFSLFQKSRRWSARLRWWDNIFITTFNCVIISTGAEKLPQAQRACLVHLCWEDKPTQKHTLSCRNNMV